MNSRKRRNAMKAYQGFSGARTVEAVMAQIPEELANALTGKQYGMVMSAVNQAFHNGKASAGAEVFDGDSVWINALDRLFDFDDLKKLPNKYSARRIGD